MVQWEELPKDELTQPALKTVVPARGLHERHEEMKPHMAWQGSILQGPCQHPATNHHE